MLAVSDTGTGMTPEVAARAFDPFFTTKPEGRGTGLGLSQVYGFTKQSGGHVKIYTEVGHGTTVKIYLPRTRRPQEVSRTRRHDTGRRRKRDDPRRRGRCGRARLRRRYTERIGYSVLRADNAEQALVVLASGAPVDILFTDVVMPGPVSTRELARRAQALHPNIAFSIRQAIRRTRLCMTAGSTMASYSYPSPIARMTWRGSCARFSPADAGRPDRSGANGGRGNSVSAGGAADRRRCDAA